MYAGIPMRVLKNDGVIALCEARGVRRHIRMMMVDDCPPGSWVMTSLGLARERIDEAAARKINLVLDEQERAARREILQRAERGLDVPGCA